MLAKGIEALYHRLHEPNAKTHVWFMHPSFKVANIKRLRDGKVMKWLYNEDVE